MDLASTFIMQQLNLLGADWYPMSQPVSLRDMIASIGEPGLLSLGEAKRGGGSSLPGVPMREVVASSENTVPIPSDHVFAERWYRGAADRYVANLDLSKVDFILAGGNASVRKIFNLVASVIPI